MDGDAVKRVESGVLRHHGASVFFRVDKSGRNITVLVIDGTDDRFEYTIVPHPTELGRVALYEGKAPHRSETERPIVAPEEVV